MQMNEKVLTALEVLKDCAENDFERHRIDILIKDLTDPPKVEIIDDNHQKFNGVIYSKQTGGYFKSPQYLHRSVVQYYYGEIPNGYEVHHQNHNTADNNFSNLQILAKDVHSALHSSGINPWNFVKYKKFICQNCGKEFEKPNLGTNKFCSSECRRNHFDRSRNIMSVCEYCGKSFKAQKRKTRFCSLECYAKSRTKNDSEIRTCQNCGKEFVALKSERKIYCSNDCACTAKNNVRCCAVCGKVFQSLSGRTKYCSKRCCKKADYERHKKLKRV